MAISSAGHAEEMFRSRKIASGTTKSQRLHLGRWRRQSAPSRSDRWPQHGGRLAGLRAHRRWRLCASFSRAQSRAMLR